MIFKEGGKVVGVEADLAQGLGQELAREVRFVELPCEELLGWGVRRSDTQLLESANAFLNRCRASGDLKRVFHRWIPKLQ
jgi:ABC-type amino acid transport substrate-binding protein